jgi:hypothetical protein
MKSQIKFALETMTRAELRAVATHLNVPRGKEKKNTIVNLTDAITLGLARFKLVFTIKTNPPAGGQFSRKLFIKKLRTYGVGKVLLRPPDIASKTLQSA